MIKTSDIVSEIIAKISCYVTNEQLENIKTVCTIVLADYQIEKKTTELLISDNNNRAKAFQMFLISKKIEGCTDGTIRYYQGVLKCFYSEIQKDISDIVSDDIRVYMAKAAMQRKISKTSQCNELRVLKSFFNWCTAEDYVVKNPTVNIKPVKIEKKIKKPFSETQIEILRQTAQLNAQTSKRDVAIIDVLFSTGCRVSELCEIRRNDIQGNEIVVFGKGEKERTVYLNARAMLSLEQYLQARTDNEPALFVSCRQPFTKLTKGSIRTIIKDLGKNAGIENCHPHRFRRTCATIALNRGMPIEQVSQMLGHESLNTTTIYARSEKDNVKQSHKKYVI